MTIDITHLRTERGGNPELIRQSQKVRGADVSLVDRVIELDAAWKKTDYDLSQKNKDINAVQKDIAVLMKAKKDAPELVAKKSKLQQEKADLVVAKKLAEENLFSTLKLVGNIVHPSVVDSQNEDDNLVVKTWYFQDDPNLKTAKLSHHELLHKIGGYEADRGVKVAGHRGYFLTGPGVDLALAIANYGLAFLAKRDYCKIMPPLFMNRDRMAATAQLSQFDEELYKVTTREDDPEPKYLIATSEQPISALHADEWVPEAELPLKYAGYSSCFRKEAGAHGKDTWGVFRVHQFEKVEQFVLCKPEDSWQIFEEMIATSEEFYQSLGLSYRVVSIVSGALNNAAAKKYDLEAWFPFQATWRELVSCSNCTDYQSRDLNIRCGSKKNDDEKRYVHLLNSTLAAVERTLCCIIENWQTDEGVRVPPVLVPFVGKDFFPFVRELKSKKKPDAAELFERKLNL